MRKTLTVWLCAALLAFPSFGFSPAMQRVLFSKGNAASCAESSTFLARTSSLGNKEINAFNNFICGMVKDGLITGNMGSTGCGSVFDLIYVFATSNTTNAKLNLCGTSYSLTYNGTPGEASQFSADNGYTGDASTVFLSSTFNVATAANTCGNGAATCNAAVSSSSMALGGYVLNSRTVSQVYSSLGASNASTTFYSSAPYRGAGSGQVVNNVSEFSETLTNANGLLVLSRTSGTAVSSYHYNSTATPTTTSGPSPVVGFPSANLYILALNNNGPAAHFSGDTLAAAFISNGLTSTQANKLSARLNQYMIDVGASYHY